MESAYQNLIFLIQVDVGYRRVDKRCEAEDSKEETGDKLVQEIVGGTCSWCPSYRIAQPEGRYQNPFQTPHEDGPKWHDMWDPIPLQGDRILTLERS